MSASVTSGQAITSASASVGEGAFVGADASVGDGGCVGSTVGVALAQALRVIDTRSITTTGKNAFLFISSHSSLLRYTIQQVALSKYRNLVTE